MSVDRIYLVANSSKPDAVRATADIEAWCRQRRIDVIPIADAVPADGDRAIVLALGGDGTVLRAANLFAEAALPILGINLGSLGFLTQTGISGLAHALEHVVEREFEIEERMRLTYEANGVSSSVLNDLVITGATASRFCELELSWGDGVVSGYPGDGLIVATATGSTAYSLSAGGPVIVPPAACILATPLAAHKLGIRPVIFPADEVLEILSHSDVQLTADGDAAGVVSTGTAIRVRRCDRPTRLVRLSDAPAFFRILDEKLNWADPEKRRRAG